MASTNCSAPTRGTSHASIDDLGVIISQARAAADALAALAVAGGLDSLKTGSLEQLAIDLHERMEVAYQMVGSIRQQQW